MVLPPAKIFSDCIGDDPIVSPMAVGIDEIPTNIGKRVVTFNMDQPSSMSHSHHHAPYPPRALRPPQKPPRTPMAEAPPPTPLQAVSELFTLDNMEKVLNCVPLTVDLRSPNSRNAESNIFSFCNVMNDGGDDEDEDEERQEGNKDQRFSKQETAEFSFMAEREAVMTGDIGTESHTQGAPKTTGTLLQLVQQTAWRLRPASLQSPPETPKASNDKRDPPREIEDDAPVAVVETTSPSDSAGNEVRFPHGLWSSSASVDEENSMPKFEDEEDDSEHGMSDVIEGTSDHVMMMRSPKAAEEEGHEPAWMDEEETYEGGGSPTSQGDTTLDLDCHFVTPASDEVDPIFAAQRAVTNAMSPNSANSNINYDEKYWMKAAEEAGTLKEEAYRANYLKLAVAAQQEKKKRIAEKRQRKDYQDDNDGEDDNSDNSSYYPDALPRPFPATVHQQEKLQQPQENDHSPYTNDDEANRHFDELMSSFELSLNRAHVALTPTSASKTPRGGVYSNVRSWEKQRQLSHRHRSLLSPILGTKKSSPQSNVLQDIDEGGGNALSKESSYEPFLEGTMGRKLNHRIATRPVDKYATETDDGGSIVSHDSVLSRAKRTVNGAVAEKERQQTPRSLQAAAADVLKKGGHGGPDAMKSTMEAPQDNVEGDEFSGGGNALDKAPRYNENEDFPDDEKVEPALDIIDYKLDGQELDHLEQQEHQEGSASSSSRRDARHRHGLKHRARLRSPADEGMGAVVQHEEAQTNENKVTDSDAPAVSSSTRDDTDELDDVVGEGGTGGITASFDSSVNWDALAYSMSDNTMSINDRSNNRPPDGPAPKVGEDGSIGSKSLDAAPSTTDENSHLSHQSNKIPHSNKQPEEQQSINNTHTTVDKSANEDGNATEAAQAWDHIKRLDRIEQIKLKHDEEIARVRGMVETKSDEENEVPISPNTSTNQVKQRKKPQEVSLPTQFLDHSSFPDDYGMTPRTQEVHYRIEAMKLQHQNNMERMRHALDDLKQGGDESSYYGDLSPTAADPAAYANNNDEKHIAERVGEWKSNAEKFNEARERFASWKVAPTPTPKQQVTSHHFNFDEARTPRRQTEDKTVCLDQSIRELMKENEKLEEEMRHIKTLSPKTFTWQPLSPITEHTQQVSTTSPSSHQNLHMVLSNSDRQNDRISGLIADVKGFLEENDRFQARLSEDIRLLS